ncbi:MAG TPA: RNA methyltransferase [Methylophilaceae bacterium]|nr:RNA methyltransferase [Methylophilaceae bacterium]HQR60140.1 RNA methyltransferase [Methylophilaceae bacterium]
MTTTLILAMKSIISRDNPTYKQLKKLAESARERRKTGHALLDGAHLVAACLAAGRLPEMLVVAESAAGNAEISGLLANTAGAQKIRLSDALFAEISPVETPTGLLAVVEIPHFPMLTRPEFGLLLEDVQDPGNLGSILRSAAAAGVQAAWLSAGCADAWSPRVLRAGMGAHFVLPVVERADLTAVATGFPGQVLAACLEGESLYRLDLAGPVAFMIGNEGAGLSRELIAAAGQRFTIPMPGRVESLNAAAAAAVCLFERVRQTHGL